jgi:transcriptional regulator with XRE-family HTH domain
MGTLVNGRSKSSTRRKPLRAGAKRRAPSVRDLVRPNGVKQGRAKLGLETIGDFATRVRRAYGLSRKQFSRLSGFSERALAAWEHGASITEPGLRRLRELQRLHNALADAMELNFIPEWLQTPNEELQGAKPIEAIERGEIDRIWRFLYYLESGMAV